MNLPSVTEAREKAALVRKNKLSVEEKQEQEMLDLLATNVRHAIDNTLPVNDTYMVVVRKKEMGNMLQRVIAKFTDGMDKAGWMVAFKEERRGFPPTTYIKISFSERSKRAS